MTEQTLDTDEARVLDGVDVGVFVSRHSIAKERISLREAFDRLVERGLIYEVQYFALTKAGEEALEAINCESEK